MKGRWAQGLEPRAFCWIIKDRLAASERPGGFARNHRKVRRQEELIWLDRPRLHAHALDARLAAQPPRVRGSRASRTRTCRSAATTSGPSGCPRSTRTLADVARRTRRSGCSSTTRSSATACSACSPGTSSTRGSSPRARTRSSSIEKITGRQLGSVAREIVAVTVDERIVAAPPLTRRAELTMGTIVITGLRELGVHGVLPEEQTRPSRSRSTSSSTSTCTPAGESDELDDTVDYSAVAEAVSRVVTSERYQLLERLATRIAEVCRGRRAGHRVSRSRCASCTRRCARWSTTSRCRIEQ